MNETPASTLAIRDLADALSGAFPRLDATDQQIAIATYRLLTRGLPASVDAIAIAADVTPAEVEKRLDSWPAVFRDSDGLVIGFWGLTVAEMPPHELRVGDVKLWAWCAWDTLFLPARLAAVLDVRSVCPVTNQQIELRVAPDHVEAWCPTASSFRFSARSGALTATSSRASAISFTSSLRARVVSSGSRGILEPSCSRSPTR